ncbi:MAG: hypothetical protein EZS28_022222 [Streblomastix strix]|uniref:Right handed beta helix domain-containing protein n=1 Tax=Streblomastix strix TaxID=222440 RepID=A0A5J4VI58_9EUKA|nr:MAG: hypothetical protein EZS28_022222 [Streblomastix strix]
MQTNYFTIFIILLIYLSYFGAIDSSASTVVIVDEYYTERQDDITVYQFGDEYIIKNCTFAGCSDEYGGALNIELRYGGQASVLDSIFTGCEAYFGGGIQLGASSASKFIIQGSQFKGCKAEENGGAINAQITDQDSIMEIGNSKFTNCESSNGGGISVTLKKAGQVIIDQGCIINQCTSNGGSGGGIYIETWFETSLWCSLVVRDTTIKNCKALLNQSSHTYPQGIGGALFLGGDGIYDPTTELIDLRGLKLIDNTADTAGSSIYVAMLSLRELFDYIVY